MGIIIGIAILLALIAIIVFEVFIVSALKLASEADKKMEEPKIEEKPHKVELTDEQKKKQEKLRENFENLMGFDYEKALKSKGE